MKEQIRLFNMDCLELMPKLQDESIDVICIDPPYLYLKNQKLERIFDDNKFFRECFRLLRPGGFVICFGRGTSFYRWNTIMHQLGFVFKEEIVWDKSHGTSPLMPISRTHETISLHCKGKGKINKVKIPYIEMKIHDIPSVIGDIKRMKSILKNTKSLDAVLNFLENNVRDTSDGCSKTQLTISSDITKEDRSVSVVRSIKTGMNEKSIIRTDQIFNEKFSKHKITSDNRKSGDRSADVMQSIHSGMNEKTIIKEIRNHYKSIHPTEKPVRLIERLLSLVIPESKKREDVFVADFFGGSFSTVEAVHNMGMNGISCEIDEEYFNLGKLRIDKLTTQTKIF